jgi:hypothetical protein
LTAQGIDSILDVCKHLSKGCSPDGAVKRERSLFRPPLFTNRFFQTELTAMASDEDDNLYDEEFDFVDDDEADDPQSDDTDIADEAAAREPSAEDAGAAEFQGEEPVDEYGRPEPAANYVVHIYEHRKFKRTIERPFTPEDAELFATEYNRTGKPYQRFALAGKNDAKPKKTLD